MQRALASLALAVACAGVAARAQQPSGASGAVEPFLGSSSKSLDRPSLIVAVLERNPTLAAARHAWTAAAAETAQATSLEDPTVGYAFAPLSVASSDTRFGEVVGFNQRLPFPGTLRLRGDVARAEASAAAYRFEEVRLELATQACALLDRYWLLERSLEITAEHIDLLASFQRVATSRYATGLAPQQAPIQAEVETAHLLHQQVTLLGARRRVVAELNALLHRRAAEPLPDPPLTLDSEAPLDQDDAAAEPSRPDLEERQARNQALEARVGLEEQKLKPDFQASMTYNSMWGPTEFRWAVGVGVRLPLWRRKLKASVAEAKARLAEGESALAALSDAIDADAEAALASLDEARHVVRLYDNRLLPAARDQLAAARSGFEAGRGSMLDLIDAQRTLLSAELRHQEAVAQASTSRAELDRALGRMPFGLAVPLSPPSIADSTNESQP